MLYLDTSAVVKLISREDHSDDLSHWLAEHDDVWVTSALTEVEAERAIRRSRPRLAPAVPDFMECLNRIEITAPIRALAARYPDPALRSLDAIHLATAHTARDTTGAALRLIAYDTRLIAAAHTIGLQTGSPGRALID